MRAVAIISVVLIALGGLVYYFRIWQSVPRDGVKFSPPMSQRVELKTKDGVSVIGDYYPSTWFDTAHHKSLGAGAPSGPSAKGLLLLHMMPADRTSWRAFAEKMQSAGWHVLAIDLRGHGESQGGPDGYKNFSDTEHQASRLDAEAGVEFLKSKGIESIYQGGASIGANLALQRLSEYPQAKGAFLLSPGLEYRGVKTEQAARTLKPGQSVYYIASRDDQYSADTIQRLYDLTPSGVHKEIKFFETAGHGTTIFEREPAFMDELAGWLASR